MTPYTPPKPTFAGCYTEAQLRSEVERVRRETVEECAEAIDDACREQIMTASDCIELIGELLK